MHCAQRQHAAAAVTLASLQFAVAEQTSHGMAMIYQRW